MPAHPTQYLYIPLSYLFLCTFLSSLPTTRYYRYRMKDPNRIHVFMYKGATGISSGSTSIPQAYGLLGIPYTTLATSPEDPILQSVKFRVPKSVRDPNSAINVAEIEGKVRALMVQYTRERKCYNPTPPSPSFCPICFDKTTQCNNLFCGVGRLRLRLRMRVRVSVCVCVCKRERKRA